MPKQKQRKPDEDYNADIIETEQDALDEEQEARRLQQKHLEAMKEDDFGADLDEEQEEQKDAPAQEDVVERVKNAHPEFRYLAKEFLELLPLHRELAAAAGVEVEGDGKDKKSKS
ncbi:hypothetical protein NA57DRAFT_80065 [Rhizodiscina lignyota]|uniref:Uncharacterized protein n=1 Tax=Rhizodiscina lignyota TaxID=1504668 RepID=A0A9P4I841_9PEZI|nr:hypothetical protein NA57DRAFT_80065 [Rhizodiscina lignyota]